MYYDTRKNEFKMFVVFTIRSYMIFYNEFTVCHVVLDVLLCILKNYHLYSFV